jgi:hypothetical protein
MGDKCFHEVGFGSVHPCNNFFNLLIDLAHKLYSITPFREIRLIDTESVDEDPACVAVITHDLEIRISIWSYPEWLPIQANLEVCIHFGPPV